MSDVVVLGCGPAGLLAAEGARAAGAEVTIVSQKVKSVIAGAQFIHGPIPTIRLDPEPVTIQKRGTREGYAKKVYADPNHPVSWDNFGEKDVINAWPMKVVYERLWKRWSGKIVDKAVTPELLDWLERGHDILVSTIPGPILCEGEHQFVSQEIGVSVFECATNYNSVIYNGEAKVNWFRSSFLFGSHSIEYGLHKNGPAVPNAPTAARRIHKPQWTDCDCRDQWRRVGRYGKWQRGVLAHEAFFEVAGVLGAADVV